MGIVIMRNKAEAGMDSLHMHIAENGTTVGMYLNVGTLAFNIAAS